MVGINAEGYISLHQCCYGEHTRPPKLGIGLCHSPLYDQETLSTPYVPFGGMNN